LGLPFDPLPIRAKVASLLRGTPLPPGDMAQPLDQVEREDRTALMTLFRHHGPIIKGRAWNETWIYVLGLPLIREILRSNEADLRSVTIDTSSLFPKGLLRQMEEQDHRAMKGAILRAIRESGTGEDFSAFRDDVLDCLSSPTGQEHRKAQHAEDPVRLSLGKIVFNELSRSILGVPPQTKAHAQLLAAYGELGGHGLVWNLGPRQKRAYAAIRTILADMPPVGGIRGHLPVELREDPDLIGNLIYMVEMGRYDTAAFLRWLLWFLASSPNWAKSIGDKDADDATALAFVSEALRLEQAERLVRKVQRDFTAGGFLFPRGAKVRFCIWESHKLDEAHADPFHFNPGRFLADKPGPDRYSPFGIGQHQCPFGTYSLRLGCAFLQAVTENFRISDPGSGPARRGLYHWEPADDFHPQFESVTQRGPT
jgi:cytochrome P450